MSCGYQLRSHFCLKTVLFRPEIPYPFSEPGVWWGVQVTSTWHFHTAMFNMVLKFSFTSPENGVLFFSLKAYSDSLERHPFTEFPPNFLTDTFWFSLTGVP